MGLKCLFGHKWDGCKCERCGKLRDEQHDWEGCKCKRCGKIRDEQHDWNGRKCKGCGKERSINEITDQGILEYIARNDSDSNIRKTAIKKLTDVFVLLDIMNNDEKNQDYFVSDTAKEKCIKLIKNQKNQSFLVNIIQNCGDSYKGYKVREAAIEMLTDQSFIEDIALRSTDFQARKAAAKKMTNKSLLSIIARNDGDSIRKEVENILIDMSESTDLIQQDSDLSSIEYSAKNESDWKKRLLAVDRLTNQTLLMDISKNDREWYIRMVAVNKITDQKFLLDIVKSDSEFEVCRSAISKLTDENTILDIVKNNNNSIYIRGAAVIGLTNQNILTDIAKNDEHDFIRSVAVSKLSDQSILTDIAKNDKDKYVRFAAVEKLTDQSVLTEIAKNDIDEFVRKAAGKRLKSEFGITVTQITYPLYTGSGVCDVCNCSLIGCKAYIVPNNVFYNSQKYRDYMKNSVMAKLMGMPINDAYFAQMQARDKSQGSAICENCIHMFEK